MKTLDSGKKPDAKRSPRHVRAAAKILQKEARKILRKHGSRVASDPAEAIRACVAAVDTHRNDDDIDGLEHEAEKLDELLHQHASFARKSALRETLENVGIAVMIALGLRACFYEPFKIPSGSMMPTLRTGDHIFVNKFAYGVQVPFTNTVLGRALGDIERGDVIVFRFPLDQSDDYIKRVVGLPGDVVRVRGRIVEVKRAGDQEFHRLEHTRLKEKCWDAEHKHELGGCQLVEENNGDRTYVVRYLSTLEERDDFIPRVKMWRVPDEHVFVMGDNRNESHDSLAWTVQTEAIDADKILSDRDLKDLTTEKLFTQARTEQLGELADPRHDHVTWLSTHRSRGHDLSLSVWRDPRLGLGPMFDALAARVEGGKPRTIGELLAGSGGPSGAQHDRVREIGAGIDRLVVGSSSSGWHALILLDPAKAILEIKCGRLVCKGEGSLATRISEVIGRFETNHELATRELLKRPRGTDYGTRWTGRSDVRDKYFERVFARGEPTPDTTPGTTQEDQVRLQVFRKPKQSIDVLQDAALRAAGQSAAEATTVPSVGERAWIVPHAQGHTFVLTDDVRDMVVVLTCPLSQCKTPEAVITLAKTVADRVPKAASDRRKLKRLLQASDLGQAWVERKVAKPARNPFDRVRLEATVQGRDHSLELEAWYKPPQGLSAKVAALRTEYELDADDAVTTGGASSSSDAAFHDVFAVEHSQTVIRMRCRRGLCPTRAVALAVARRAANRALDASSFIDPDAERPQPFVPMGHVKGRAERIWLPTGRFWLKIK